MQRTRLTNWIALTLLGGCAALNSPAAGHCASPASSVRNATPVVAAADEQAAALIKLGQERSTKAVPVLAVSLEHESTLVRRSAAWALTQMGAAAKPALPQLMQALTDVDEQVRWAAVTTLGQIGNKAALAEAAIITVVCDPNVDVQCAALTALRAIGIRDLELALPALKHCLETDAPELQSEALATVSAFLPQWNDDTKRQIAPSIAATAAVDDDDVRLAAFVLLSDLGLEAAPALTLLVRGASDLDEHIQAAAIRALDRFADAVDQQRSELNDNQLKSLRRPCKLAAQALSSPAHDSSDCLRLATRFKEFADGTTASTGEQSLARSTAKTKSHRLVEDDDALNPNAGENGRAGEEAKPTLAMASIDETEVATSTVPVANIASVAKGNGWRAVWWALGAIAVAVALWLVRRGLSHDETADNVKFQISNPDSVPANLNTQLTNLTNFDLGQSAEADLIDAHVLPAVMASLPAAQAVDEVAPNKLERPITESPVTQQPQPVVQVPQSVAQASQLTVRDAESTQPKQSQSTGVAERREEINRLSDVALDVTAKLNRAMSDADSVVRWRAASAITAAHAATTPQLLAAITSNDPEVRRLAVSSLQGLGKEAVPPFVQALKDPNADLRHAAANALGRIGPGAIDSVPQLTSVLKDPDARVRAAAAFALSAFGSQAFAAIPALRQALTDTVPAVRARAAFALGQIGPAAKEAIRELARLVSEPDATVRRNAVSALGGIGADAGAALPELMAAAHDVDDGVRRCVMSVLGLIAPSTAEAILRQALSDKDAEVRHCAHAALASSGLGQVAKQTDTNPTRTTASQSKQPITLKVFQPQDSGAATIARQPALTQQSTDSSDDVAALMQALESPDKDRRFHATQALGQLGSRAVPAIIAVMPRHNSETRRLLIHALGRIGNEARPAIPVLLEALQDPHADVRCAAADGLGRMGIVNPVMLQALTQALSDRDAEVRRYAATTLGRFGQFARNTQVDLQVAALGDPEAKVRAAADAALQRIMGPALRAA